MTELCFAEFVRCLQSAMQPPNDDKDIVELLLGWITEKASVVDRKGNSINIAPSLISDLLKRKVDVPKAIKNACTTKQIIADAQKHCETKIIPYMNAITSDDMFEAMRRAIDSDDVIAAKKKKELLALLDSGKESEFLGNLLLYVINRENRLSDMPLVSDDIPLLAESNYECPICHQPLIKYVKNTPVKKYKVVNIYPDNFSESNSEFSLIKKPQKVDAPSNKIALCCDHAEEYATEPTVEDYTKLKTLKDQLASTHHLLLDISQLRALHVDQGLGKKGFKKNYDDLLHFFPEVDLKKIEAIEGFHKQLTNILKNEFSEAEENIQATLSLVENEIAQIEFSITQIAKTTDLSKAVLDQYATVDNELKELQAANENYTKKKELSVIANDYEAELNRLVVEQMAIMQQKINTEMAEINDVIYNGRKTAPTLNIIDASKYTFFTPRDGGTGAQYKGLVVFDLAMLKLTRLPVIAHDSLMLKNIEDDAIEKIMELYASTPKQVFIAMDKEGSYTPKAQKIMEDNKVLQLNADEGALFGRTWNDVEVENN